ncbi:MAG: hypothetical protein PHU49_01735 [Syntrophorhabdaceae bacterium]|nr:hypothetical protein [Syntrophorhabdaceae bacterium]
MIATAVFAEPFWIFKTGHTTKYTRQKSNGENWLVTMTIGAGSQSQYGRNDFYKVDEKNYDNDSKTTSHYLRVIETKGWQCNTGTGIAYKFLEVGKPGGYGWSYGDNTNGVKFQIAAVSRFGAMITVRRYEIQEEVSHPPVFNTFL